jgi:hypothetical protein
MKALLLLSVLISLSSPALARIGETPEQCEARYGKPVKTLEKGLRRGAVYEKAGLQIQCEFHDNKCEYIYFKHLENNADGSKKFFAESELEILRDANSGGKEWTLPEKRHETFQTLRCGGLEAFYPHDRPSYLLITTQAHRDRTKAERQAEEEADKAEKKAKEKEQSKLKDF